MSDKDKYYIDGYGTKRPKDVPFWDSAKGQLVKKAGNDLLTTGSFALGLGATGTYIYLRNEKGSR